MTCPQHDTTRLHRSAPRWTRQQIQNARRAPLVQLLSARGLHLHETGAQNYRVREHPGIVVKNSFWREPDTDRAGNTIDFFVHVLGMSFNEAMREISPQ